MKKKILVIVVTLLAVAIMLTPLAVQAIPGAEKKNEKFLSLQITKVSGPPVGPVVVINRPAPPKEAEFRRVIMPEGLSYAEILVDGNSYYLGVHFTYDSTATIDFHLNSDPVFCAITVDHAYVFTEESGIDGSLEILLVGKFWPDGKTGDGPAESWGSSRGHGTGDLEGVKLMATGWSEPTGEIIHRGTITGWPDV